MGHEEFIKSLKHSFPEALADTERHENGILHCEVAVFRMSVESAIDDGQLWYAEKAFRFVEACLDRADKYLEDALEISFIEDFTLGEHHDARLTFVRERVSKRLRRLLAESHEVWK